MRNPVLQSGANLGHGDSVGYSKTRVRATSSVNASHGGSGIQKRGETYIQNKMRNPTRPLDSAVDHTNAPRKAKRIQSKHVGDDDGGGGGGISDESRVVCPFRKYDPKSYQMSSCKGKGFNELAKMKDHFKQVHGSSQEVRNADLNFKKKEYTSLATLGDKWRLVFRRLFPHVASIPSPYANEQEDSDAFLYEVAKKVALIRNDDGLQELIIKIAQDLKEDRFTRSKSVDSAVALELEDSEITKVDEPITPPPWPYRGSSRMAVDEAYSELSPERAQKAIREPHSQAQSTALLWSYQWGSGAGLAPADDGARDARIQPSQAVSAAHFTLSESGSYFDLLHERTPQSGPDTVTASAPFTTQGNAPLDMSTGPFAISSHQPNDDFVYYDSTVAPMALNQHPHYLSTESFETLPATHPSLEEHSQIWTSIPSQYLDGLNEGFDTEDWVQTSMLSAEIGSCQDQGICVGG
ncbi:hypothetical protein ACET3X_005133 [Alternaria dauci]|uniref:Uncharacterized protein n=1 Tax=Alternaria dauci TaxID=48095 RepID=A0ABR3UJD8_9PLEO